jgi:hypothetical protein
MMVFCSMGIRLLPGWIKIAQDDGNDKGIKAAIRVIWEYPFGWKVPR